MQQIIYAVIGTGPGDGIITMGESLDRQLPLVSLLAERIPDFTVIAKDASERSGREIIVAKFTLTEVIERFGAKQ